MSNLDKYQKEAVKANSKSILVIAPPGAGKTTVILNRIKYLLEEKKIRGIHVVVITFTKAAAENMKSRFKEMHREGVIPFFGTFHGLFYKILLRNKEDIRIIEAKDAYKVIKKVLSTYIEEVSDEKIKEVLNNISRKKVSSKDLEISMTQDIFDKCYEAYETFKNERGLLDFDDLQIKAVALLKNNPHILGYYRNLIKYILVDEFQDCDEVQLEFLRLINNEVFCVGDEDQSIYSFRGATPKCMINFGQDFEGSEKVYLKYNYRSLKNIVEVSKDIIKHNKERYQKEIIAFNENEGNIELKKPFNESEEANMIIGKIEEAKRLGNKYSDNAILYRTNMESRSFIDAFIRKKIPFKLLDKEYNFFNHFICKDLIAYLRLAIDPFNKEDFNKIINKPFRYVSKSAIYGVFNSKKQENVFDILMSGEGVHPFQMRKFEELKNDIAYLNKLSLNSAIDFILSDLEYSQYIREYSSKFKQNQEELLDIVDEFKSSATEFKSIINFLAHIESVEENLENINSKGNIDSVILSTMHGVKGMQFKNVHIVNVVDETIPHKNSMENLEEERRLFYVGITRAISNLYIYAPKNVRGKFKDPSIFLSNINLEDESSIRDYGLKEGDVVRHNYFGIGEIFKIDNDTVEVKFVQGGSKKFSLRTLIENNLVEKIICEV
ncbi:ATP-dependent helicase [Clostridium sp. LIBA-8841]|uniref:ATP-dependent helicase n=1 Tax=Clostridium sp. LIBA-8841 TaxID=2987530 RepID=UPI002AC56638|nr:ATP-dependent helicase [Clostridium sp. LIBA-8841]MDZ5253213.1 ATP-dependent helicase [Clostridium sp. LIBA-8841]